MGESRRRSWVGVALLLGLGYALVGIVFAVPATHAQAWRLATWGVSAAFGASVVLKRTGNKTPAG
jgi:hypothetical protein